MEGTPWEAASATEREAVPRQSVAVAHQWAALAAFTGSPPSEEAEEKEGQCIFNPEDSEHLPRKRGRPKKAPSSATGATAPSPATGAPAASSGHPTQSSELQPLRMLPSRKPTPEPAINLAVSFVPQAKKGRLSQSPLHDAMLQGQQLADLAGAVLDEGVLSVAEFYFDPEQYHLASAAVLQATLRLDSAGLQSRLRRLAATLLLQQLHERWLLEQMLVASLPVGSLRFYLDSVAYDETPMKLGIQAVDPKQDHSMQPLMPEAFFGVIPRGRTKAEASIVKLLQTRASFAILVEIPDQCVAIFGQHHSPLQAMPRTTGQALRDCLLISTGVSLEADRFPLKCRSVVCDRAGYNKKGEQLLVQDRGNWCTCVFWCDIRTIAGSFAKTFEGLAAPDITGMLNRALSLRSHGSWTLLRQSLKEEIMSRELLVHEGPCVPEVQAFKKSLLSLAVEDGGLKGLDAVVTLLCSANGNWGLRDQLDFSGKHQAGVSPQRSTSSRSTWLTASWTPSPLTDLWPRHRWTGFKAAICDLLMLQAVHGLLVPAYRRFLRHVQQKPPPGEAQAESAAVPASTSQQQGAGSHADSSMPAPSTKDRAGRSRPGGRL